jgi:hypothetical protein
MRPLAPGSMPVEQRQQRWSPGGRGTYEHGYSLEMNRLYVGTRLQVDLSYARQPSLNTHSTDLVSAGTGHHQTCTYSVERAQPALPRTC